MDVVTRNHVTVSGRGSRPMVFAHGFGCDQNMWRFITPAFEDRYKIILFDHVGHGQSDAAAFDQTKYASLDGYADDVLVIGTEAAGLAGDRALARSLGGGQYEVELVLGRHPS